VQVLQRPRRAPCSDALLDGECLAYVVVLFNESIDVGEYLAQ
jgi:hypothetical protein